MSDAGDPTLPPVPPSGPRPDAAPPVTTEVPASTTRDVELVPPAPSTSEWPAQATDAVVKLVDQVRAKTTGPAITIARGLVFGLVVAVLGLTIAVVLLVFLIRLTTELLELAWDGADVWLTYTIYGVLFTVVGLVVFSRRHVRGLG